MKLYHWSLLFGLFFLFAINMNGQVTMGSTVTPRPGALLDLTEGSKTTKGLNLPRVRLVTQTPAQNQLAESIGSTSGTNPWDPEEHIGLIVYNVVESKYCEAKPIVKGMYVWDGTEWVQLDKNESYEFVDSRDGEKYLAGHFGAAGDWMLENLRYDPILHEDRANGFKKEDFTHTAAFNNPPYTDKYFFYAVGSIYTPTGGVPANWDKYKQNGIFYNWAAATNNESTSTIDEGQTASGTDLTARIRGICPKGWHLPSDKEWNDLEKEIYENTHKYSNYTTGIGTWNPDWAYATGERPATGDGQGRAMKSDCTVYNTNHPGSKPNGSSLPSIKGGFNVLLIGFVGGNSIYVYGQYAYFRSSSTNSDIKAWTRSLDNDKPVVRRHPSLAEFLMSVRCKKD